MAARFVLPRLAGRLSATLRTLTLVAVIALVAAPAATAAAAATNGPDFAAIDRHVREQLDGARVPGGALGIVQGDRIAHLAGFGVADATGRAVTPQTPFMIGSVTKSFTALAIMQLVEAG